MQQGSAVARLRTAVAFHSSTNTRCDTRCIACESHNLYMMLACRGVAVEPYRLYIFHINDDILGGGMLRGLGRTRVARLYENCSRSVPQSPPGWREYYIHEADNKRQTSERAALTNSNRSKTKYQNGTECTVPAFANDQRAAMPVQDSSDASPGRIRARSS